MPVKIFFCYAHEDEVLLNKLKKHLRPLQRQGLIDVWYDRNINAGTRWKHEISQHFNAAQIVLLLVSPDFIDSEYCYGIEMKQAIERHKRGEASVIPIILRPVDWQMTPLAHFQAIPIDGKPVTTWRNRDEALQDVARGVGDVVRELLLWKDQIPITHRETITEKAPQMPNDTTYEVAPALEVYFPEQNNRDVTEAAPFFHAATEQAHQPLQLEPSITPYENIDSPLELESHLPKLVLPEKRRDVRLKHSRTHRKRAYRYILVVLATVLIVSLISSSWWYPVLFKSKTRLQSLNSPLAVSFNAIESKLWVIPGNPTRYTLKNLPEKQLLPGALYTDGHLAAPLYHLYLELQNLSKEQYSNILIKEIKLKILQIRPLSQRPAPLWIDNEAFHYESPHKYEALYLGSESGYVIADHVNSDYLTNNSDLLTLSPQETETAELHIISRREADILFSIQVVYYFAAESFSRTFTLASTLEVMFFDKSNTNLYRLEGGRFIAKV